MVKEQIDIKQLRTLFKYISDSPEVVDCIFRKHKIRFTQPAALNDPLEFNPAIRFDSESINFNRYKCGLITMPSIHDWFQLNLIEPRINKYGILSLTDNPYSFEMWCHYANGHKGFLIEFNIEDKSKPLLKLNEGINLKVYKVKYVKDYSINIDRLEKGTNSIPFNKIRDSIFLRKSKHWKYEREYRIIRDLVECETYKPRKNRLSYRNDKIYLFPISLDCISSIIFGVYTPKEIKQRVIEACKNTKINFLQTIIYKDLQNRIDFVPIDGFGTTEWYLELSPQIFIHDSIIQKYARDYINLNSHKELPYYQEQPRDLDRYYKTRLKMINDKK